MLKKIMLNIAFWCDKYLKWHNCDIKTLEGVMHANYGDYIIKGVKGEIYPCKPDIFEETYEILESQEINRLC